MNVIRPTYLLVLITCLIMVSCFGGPDPIEGRNTYSIENMTDENIKIIYTYVNNFGSLSGKSDSSIIEPRINKTLNDFRGGYPDYGPSKIYKSIIFLSYQNDTLYNMNVINDDTWILIDSVVDYGYKVGYYHWLYKFSN